MILFFLKKKRTTWGSCEMQIRIKLVWVESEMWPFLMGWGHFWQGYPCSSSGYCPCVCPEFVGRAWKLGYPILG